MSIYLLTHVSVEVEAEDDLYFCLYKRFTFHSHTFVNRQHRCEEASWIRDETSSRIYDQVRLPQIRLFSKKHENFYEFVLFDRRMQLFR